MKLRIVLYLIVFTMPLQYAYTQSWSIGAKNGLIFPDNRIRELVNWTYGFEAGFVNQSEGSTYWEQQLNYPIRMLEFGFYDFLNEQVGLAGVFRNSLLIPFWEGEKWFLSSEWGIGLGYFTKTNRAIGQPISFNIRMGGNIHWLLNEDYTLLFRYHVDHYSNGSMSLPNLGINYNNFGFALISHHQKTDLNKKVIPAPSRSSFISLTGAAGWKRTFSDDRLRYHSAWVARYTHYIQPLWGVSSGFALFHNLSLVANMENEGIIDPSPFRAGWFAGPAAKLDKLWLELHFGLYLLNPYPDESSNFQLILMGYQFHRNISGLLMLRVRNFDSSYGIGIGLNYHLHML